MTYRWSNRIAIAGVLCLVVAGIIWILTDEPVIDPDEPIVDTRACKAVWQDGRRLPDDYDGCVNPANIFVEPVRLSCGARSLIVFEREDTWLSAEVEDRVIHERGNRPCPKMSGPQEFSSPGQ